MWRTLKRKAGVVLSALDADGKNVKFTYYIAVRAGDLEDYEGHWTSQGMDAKRTLESLLNTKNAHDATETTEKGIVRATVTEVEKEILDQHPKGIKPEKLVGLIAKDERVIEAIKNHDVAAQMFVIGDTRGADGEMTKTQAAEIGKKLLQVDPDKLKALAAEMGFEL